MGNGTRQITPIKKMKNAWYLRLRQILVSLRFWVAITGYDIRDRSKSGRIYLLYLVIFFSVWGLAVLAMVSAAVARGLLLFFPVEPAFGSVILLTGAMFIWWVYSLISASRHSPIHFSSEDAVLICSTPIPRPGVVFTWFVSELFVTGVPFWGLGIILGFSLADITANGSPFWNNIPLYLSKGFHFFLLTAILQFGMLALVWAFGCWRLQNGQKRKGFTWISLIISLAILASVVTGLLPTTSSSPFSQAIVAPYLAAAGLSEYLPGLCTALLVAFLGLVLLWMSARHFNLSRAAQETDKSQGGLGSLIDKEINDDFLVKNRLTKSRSPSRMNAQPGALILLWKNWLQILRSSNLNTMFGWFTLMGLGLGALLAPDWASRSLLAVYWVVNVLQFASRRLRKDLGNWLLFQSLPLPLHSRLWLEALPAIVGITTTSWIVLMTAQIFGWVTSPWYIYIVMLPFSAVVSAVAELDVLRQTRSDHLITGRIPSPGIIAVLMAVFIMAMNLILILVSWNNILKLTILLIFNVLCGIGINARFSKYYRSIGK
jgi:hypothetical protein